MGSIMFQDDSSSIDKSFTASNATQFEGKPLTAFRSLYQDDPLAKTLGGDSPSQGLNRS
jgi:hypothetical protein